MVVEIVNSPLLFIIIYTLHTRTTETETTPIPYVDLMFYPRRTVCCVIILLLCVQNNNNISIIINT